MVQEELVQLLLIVLDDNKEVEVDDAAVADDDADDDDTITDIGIGPLEVEESIGSVFEFSKEVGIGGGGGRELTDLPLGAADDVEEDDGNFRLDGPGLLGGT